MDINEKQKSSLGNDSKLENKKNLVTGIRTSDLQKEAGNDEKKDSGGDKGNSRKS